MWSRKSYVTDSRQGSIDLTILVASCGYFAASVTGSPDIFARTGALIVMIGIMYAVYGFTDQLEKIREDANEESEDYIESVQSGSKREGFKQILIETAVSHQEKIEREARIEKDKLIKTEAAILMFGTFVWGFGDLLVTNRFNWITL